jgi:hypothetical protein
MKKLISMFTAIVIAIGMMGTIPIVAESIDGDYEYEITDYFTVSITGYMGSPGAITIPSEIDGYPVTNIAARAFTSTWESDALTSITIPNSITVIEENALPNEPFNSLTEIIVDNGNPAFISIGGVLFDKVTDELVYNPVGREDTEYTLPDGTSGIGKAAFKNCDNLLTVDIPVGVKTIGESAFEGCIGLGYADIPDTVTSIGQIAFKDCSLSSVFIPNKVAEIGWAAFYGNKLLNEITVDEDNPNFTAEDGVLFNKRMTTLVDYPDSRAGNYSVPDGVTEIADDAFGQSSAIIVVDIPSSVTKLDFFNDCNMLTTINVDSENPNYASVDGVLFNKDMTKLIDYPGGKLGEYTIPDSVTEIGSGSFANSNMLTVVTIPDSVKTIGNYAFQSCEALESVTIPNSVTSIGEQAFYNNPSLKKVVIPPSVTSIAQNAFQYCDVLTIYCLIETYAATYAEDNYLEVYYLQYEEMFPDMHYFTYNVLEDGTAEITGYTGEETNLEIPSKLDGYTVSVIGYNAFYERTSLTGVTIPDTVTKIDYNAFYRCESLKEVTIPSGVTEIGISAFMSCTSLTKITIPASVTLIDADAFFGCDDLTIYGVADSAAQSYAEYDDIPFVEIDGGTTEPTEPTKPSTPAEDFDYDVSENGTVRIYGYTGSSTDVIIPSKIEGLAVTEIASFTFSDNSMLTFIMISDSVTSIGDYAFSGCGNLQTVYIPANVTFIGDGILQDCGNAMIYGKAGTHAQAYAAANGIAFIDIDAEPTEPDPTEPIEPDPTEPIEPNPTEPIESDPTEPSEPTQIGDVNNDNAVNISDLVAICKHVVGVVGAELTGTALANSDCDGDGVTNSDADDAMKLAQFLVKKIPSLPDAA